MSAPQVFLTETRERFLKAVVAELPAERIRELYLFAPIRQGGVESGIAVIAAALPESGEALDIGAAPIAESVETPDVGAAPIAESGEALDIGAAPIAESVETPDVGAAPIAESVETSDIGAAPIAESVETPDVGAAPNADDSELPAAGAAAPVRYTVYTARYRHTQKGPDRGKWESSVVAEADAPLLSIETVVRGVQRRSGDVDPPDHMSGDEVRSALRLTPAADT